jgi:cyclopropane fatty-acyl-phospholipid synthase-like methyltransferase
MSNHPHLQQQLENMRRDWDARAKENARYYVATGRTDWTDEEFFASGEKTVSEEILTDMTNICQGKDPSAMRVLEIGCGAGRLTRALSKVFGEVHAVDISAEMIAEARKALADRPNAHVYHNNGCDLTVIPPLEFDFAFSAIVFQHIPSREVIESYVREVHRLLRTGALFKFCVQGYSGMDSSPDDTWLGVSFSKEQAVAMAHRAGFEPRYSHGAETQYFYQWFFNRSWLGSIGSRVWWRLKSAAKRTRNAIRARIPVASNDKP